MYKVPKVTKTSLRVNASVEGQTIEEKMRRVFLNNEPIEEGAPLIYTDDRSMRPEHDIRTDRWDYALDEVEAVERNIMAKRDAVMQVPENNAEPAGGEQSTDANLG